MRRFLIGILSLSIASCTVNTDPITNQERKKHVEEDLVIARATRFMPDKPITLYEAMARAVTFNLESRVREIEAEIAEAELEQASYKLLPAFDTGAGVDRKSRSPSDDSDKNQRNANAGLTWNILDLGVSYARAQQQANQVLIAKERKRKAYNDILRDVRLAYWRAASAARLLRNASKLSSQIQKALKYSIELEVDQVRDAKISIASRRSLLDSVRQMVAFRREISNARAQLAEILNIPPDFSFELVEPAEEYRMFPVPMSFSEMGKFALQERAEMRTEDYQKRIDSWHQRELLYDLLPGIDLNLGLEYSSDSFLENSTFVSSGFNVAMNLFNLFAIPGRLGAQEQSEKLADSRRLALAIAIVAQVHLSYKQYQDATYLFALTKRIADADRSLTGLARDETGLLNGGFLEVIDASAREMVTSLEEHRAYLEIVKTHNELMHAVGVNGSVEPPADVGIVEFAAILRDQYQDWDCAVGAADRLKDMSLEALVESALPSTGITRYQDLATKNAGAYCALASVEREDDADIAELSEEEPDSASRTGDRNSAITEAKKGKLAIATVGETASVSDPAVATANTGGLDASQVAANVQGSDATATADETATTFDPAAGPMRAIVADAGRGTAIAQDNGVGDASQSIPQRKFGHPKTMHYVVQAGIFRNPRGADKVAEELAKGHDLGNSSDLIHIDVLVPKKGTKLYAVMLGPLFSRDGATAACKRIKEHGFDCLVLLRRKKNIASAISTN